MRLLVGRIGRAHGILGEATIEVRTDQPEVRFAIGSRVQTDKHAELVVTSHRFHNGILLLGFAGIADRSAIEKLRDTLMYCEVDIDAPSEYQDDYHVLQLTGCKAFLESGIEFGTVKDVINLPAQDLLAIDTPNGEVLIPFVHQLVPVVDTANRRITVIPPTMESLIE
jgi:16S rRNA processing protein RimM